MNRREFLAAAAAVALPYSASAAAGQPMKVFALDDIEWWAGPSLEACVAAGKAACGDDCYDEPDDYAELDDAAMQRLVFVDDDGTRRSFAEELARRVAAGETFPQPFAASDW
jgi:hypothetical protein